MTFSIAPLTHDAVDAYVEAHVAMTWLTYAHFVTPQFLLDRRAEVPARVASVHGQLDEWAEAEASGREPHRRHFVARNERGGIVGVASAGEGVEPWEVEVAGDAWFAPASSFDLSHLYTVPGVHGTGLGQALLDAALPAGRDAYLWAYETNPRALAFYTRNGFAADGLVIPTGESWGDSTILRMVRGGPSVAEGPLVE